MSWGVAPRVARSARIRPITTPNLKPWPEHAERDHDLRVRRVAVEDEVLVGRHRVAARDVSDDAAGEARRSSARRRRRAGCRMSGMIERSSSAGSDGRADAVDHALDADRLALDREARAERRRPGQPRDEQREPAGHELRRVDRLEERELLLEHGQRRRQPERRASSGPIQAPFAITQASPAIVAGVGRDAARRRRRA